MTSAAVLLCVTVAPAGAQTCEMPPQLAQLSASLASLPDEAGPISVRLAGQLSAQLNQIDGQDMVVKLRENDLQSLSRVVADLINEAGKIGSTAEISDVRRLNMLLWNLNQMSLFACAESDGRIFDDFKQEQGGGMPSSNGIDWEAVDRLLSKDSALSVGILVILVIGVVGALFLADASYRMAMALLYNRKACRIPVILRLGTDTFEATMTTLGRGGCRIMPQDPEFFDENLAKMRQMPVLIEIEDTVIEANISAIYHDVSDFRFTNSVPLKAQKELFQLSTISPFYIKKSKNKPSKSADSTA